jgi:hypothetical protein
VYASPRARARRNARCDAARASAPIVVYVIDQSTESPRRRHNASKAASSTAVSTVHSSTKLRREIARGGSKALSGGVKEGS